MRIVQTVLMASILACGLALTPDPAAAQAAKPITKQGLLDALKIGGLSLQELIQFVRDRGVDFQVNAETEMELRNAAAQRELIDAVRANYRGLAPAASPLPGAPLLKNEVITLLQVGTPAARIEQLVNERGASFQVTPEVAKELEAAGATAALIETIIRRNVAPVQAPAPVQTQAPAATPPAAPAAPANTPKPVPNISSVKEIKKLFVEKMPSDLDQFIRAELTKKLKERIVVVALKEEADGVMVGTGENRTGTGAQITGRYLGLHDNATGAVSVTDRTGTQVLWSSEAGDRSLLFGAMKRGGPRKVAERLVNNFKKALED